ncbi:MAG: hypothetical protein DI626_08445 [Micavibrio aeruginosavorus]|uniref:Uncharacterized protein n=1 Tax=Micavibrio aeruginosavorus TaxID=349221 RepID=A0A2W4ZSS1_9BACT|nr:MAG: hypothetical protein DI626_08445 [Micavibrio aeruginosavorus]
MGRDEGNERVNAALKPSGFIVLVFMCALLFSPTPVYAESLTLKRPLNSTVTSPFGWRKASQTGGNVSYDRLHAGTDYRARTPTPVPYEGSHQSCKNGIATIQNACNVSQRFIHLSDCSKGNLVSGSTGTKAPHLHHELRIGSTPVDGEHYFTGACGTDLCTEQVRKCLLDHAKTKGGSGGSASDAASSNAPQPADAQNPTTSTYVGTGSPDPVSGEVNRGSPYYLDTGDGRVTREPILDTSENVMPVLPDTVTTGFTQPTTTSNEITGCATDTWTAMVNMAVLQTRRETIINQALIAKADSVMAYSCMNESMKKVGENLGPIFSETKRWVNAQIDIEGKTVTVNKELGESSLDGAVFGAATNAYMNYAQKSFKHSMMGGMLDIGGNENGSEDPASEDAGAQDAMPCGVMNQVWQMAKCMNYGDVPGFPKFEDLISGDKDPRKYPKNMTCKNTGITQAMIDTARHKEVEKSKLQLHYDQIRPDNNACGPAIATGVTVNIRKDGIISRLETYQDGICISPGCSYQTSGYSGTGKCEVKKP